MREKYAAIRLLTVIVLLGGLSGCGRSSGVASSASDDPKTRWLEGVPCAPPCWENIQPGTTRPEQAIELLKASPAIDPASVQVEELKGEGINVVTWAFLSQSTPWNGRIVYQVGAQNISGISLTVPDLCLGEIIDAYGKPDYLHLPGYQAAGLTDLVWVSHGFVFQKELGSLGKPITADTCNGTLVQFTVGTPFQEMPLPTFLFSQDSEFVPWTGYGKY